jgi:hypothetical protein
MRGFEAASASRPLLALLFLIVLYTAFFSPALFSRKILAPADGYLFYYPHYNSSFRTWDPLLMTGYPEFADPQIMRWYPLSMVFHIFPGSWNMFVVFTYVFASWFMYLLVRKLTGTDFAGLVSGMIFGLGGFMNLQLGHITMIQAALWIPAILLCAEHLAAGIQWRWIALGGLAVGACILAGHPQIALYGMTLALGYIAVRGFSAVSAKSHYYAAAILMIILGFALSAVQTLATAQMAGFSTRAFLSFTDFSSYSLPPAQLISLLFPYLFGGVGPKYLSGISYFGAWSATELAGYVGLSGLLLAAIAVISRRTTRVFFWLAALLVSLIASMGAATPLGRILYALPGFGQFRVPARFLLVFGISAAVLAGYGVSSILEKRRDLWSVRTTIAAALGMILSAAVIALWFAEPLQKLAAASGVQQYSASALSNWWIGIPLLISCAMCVVLVIFIRWPQSLMSRGAFLAAVIVELSVFSWYGEWRFVSPDTKELELPDLIRRVGPAVRHMDARWVPVRGYEATKAEAPGDLSLLWQLPSLSKYGPLLPARYQDLLNMETNGQFMGSWWKPENRALDINAGRFFAVAETQPQPGRIFRGVLFSHEDFTVSVGNGCGAEVHSTTFSVGQPRAIGGLGLVTLSGCSTEFEAGTPLAELRLHEPDGTNIPLTIRAGMDTADWSAACADVAPVIQRPAAAVYAQTPVPRGAGTCPAQTYADIIDFPKPVTLSGLELRWLPARAGALMINKISLLDANGGGAQPLSEQEVRYGDPAHWKRIDQTEGVGVYENLHAMPRVWLTSETVSASPDEIKRAIQTSRLPDGRLYDPAAVALVEERPAFHAASDPGARATLVKELGSSLEIQTASQQPAFMVLADFYYPGWEATVNGKPTHIYRTNYIQRGILVPPGNNLVHFEFHPTRLYVGGTISLATLLGMIGTAFLTRRREAL